MLGMFVILPVFAIYAEGLPGGDNLTLVGIAIGVYGLTQAILQIPFGWWSDRYGRKPVIYVGLAIFAARQLRRGARHRHLHRDPGPHAAGRGRDFRGGDGDGGRSHARRAPHQGDGDDRLHHRRTFALSLVLSPWLNRVIGVPGIFAMTGVLVLVAMGVVYAVVPRCPAAAAAAPARAAWSSSQRCCAIRSSRGSTTAYSRCTPC